MTPPLLNTTTPEESRSLAALDALSRRGEDKSGNLSIIGKITAVLSPPRSHTNRAIFRCRCQCNQRLRLDAAEPHHWNPLRPIVCPLTLELASQPGALLRHGSHRFEMQAYVADVSLIMFFSCLENCTHKTRDRPALFRRPT